MKDHIIFWTHPIMGCGIVNWGGDAPVEEGRDTAAFKGTLRECLDMADRVNGQLDLFIVPIDGGDVVKVER
jgi:hypothetical protein